MPKKRGNNEGTVYKRESDGKWVGAVTLGYNQQGNPNRRVVYGKTRQEAAKKLADLLDKFNKGILAEPSSITVEEFAKGWIDRESEGKSQNTVRNIETELGYSTAFIGKMKIQQVKATDIERFLRHLKAENYSKSVQKKALGRLSTLFTDAIRLDLIYKNPCTGIQVKMPSLTDEEETGRTLEAWEVQQLIPALEAHPMGLLFRLLLDCGLRRGEGLALTWDDLDLYAKIPRLSVNKNWTGDGYMSKPKTKRSYRRIPIPTQTAEMLIGLRQATLQTFGENIGSTFLFGDIVRGKPFHPNSVNTALKRIISANGLPVFTPHDLRHTYGSVLLAKGVPVAVVSERMGHKDSTVTLQIYRHVLEIERDDYLMGTIEAIGTLAASPLPSTTH